MLIPNRERRTSRLFIVTLLIYIMQNVRLDEAQTGINIARRNINNLRYADDTMHMAENKEEIRAS